jgi:cytoskeletal protein CcmA (bactofilin family)
MKIRDLFNIIMETKTYSSDEDIMEISGIFNGCVYNGSQVFVTSSGILNGEVQTKRLVIDGTVKGVIKADNLVIRSSGKIFYERLEYKDIIAEEGSLISLSKINERLDFVERNVSDEVAALEEQPVKHQQVQSTKDDKNLNMFKNENKRPPLVIGGCNGEVSSDKPRVRETSNNVENSIIKRQPHFQTSF